MDDKKFYIAEKFKKFGIDISDKMRDQLLSYYEMLVDRNKVMNLTAITEFEEVVEKHFIDSAAVVLVENLTEEKKLIDVGSGAGFPGIPLKILFPNLKVTLLDSLNKRILFLQEVIESLGLKDIEAIHFRAEDCAKNIKYREQFDLCVSRAVANLSSLSEYCLPFLKVGGRFISYKSTCIDNEVDDAKNAVFLLGGKLSGKKEFVLPGSDIGRSFIIIEKVRKTPGKYPRKAGLPSRDPL